MKTAEFWQEMLLNVNAMCDNESLLIREIQLDAFKAGMTRAAEVASQQAADDALAGDATTDLGIRLQYRAQQERALAIELKILSTRDNMKEI